MNITINSGSVNAEFYVLVPELAAAACKVILAVIVVPLVVDLSIMLEIDCTPHKNLDSSGNYDPNSPNVYLCTIPNEGNRSNNYR